MVVEDEGKEQRRGVHQSRRREDETQKQWLMERRGRCGRHGPFARFVRQDGHGSRAENAGPTCGRTT